MTASERFKALQELMTGYLSSETAESERERDREARKPKGARRPIPDGFVENSDAWKAARLIGWPLIELKPSGDGQAEMFEAPLMPRFAIDADWHDEIPIALGGEEPDDAYRELDEAGTCIAWDDERVLFWCPRGVCSIERARWQEGWRHCAGC